MPSSTSIPIIVQGNSFSLAIPLQIYAISEGSMVLQDYTPDPTDQVSIQLKGSRRQYTYTPSITDNIAYIDLSGNEMADNYGIVVSIVKENGQRLRSFRTDQFFIVESSDDLTTDDIIEGLENNVIYLNSQAFVAGADGRGIDSIVKTGTSGLVDTYTIYYSDNTTSTFDVTNGAQGQQGEDGVGITSITKTSTSGLVDTYTIILSNGDTTTFDVTNGMNGVDLGEANIVNNLTTGGSTNVLSAEMGKVLKGLIDDFSGSLLMFKGSVTANEVTQYKFDGVVGLSYRLFNGSENAISALYLYDEGTIDSTPLLTNIEPDTYIDFTLPHDTNRIGIVWEGIDSAGWLSATCISFVQAIPIGIINPRMYGTTHTSYYFTMSDGEPASGSQEWGYIDYYFKVEPGTSITLKNFFKINGVTANYVFYDEQKQILSQGQGDGAVTVPANARFVRFCSRNTDNISVEGCIIFSYEQQDIADYLQNFNYNLNRNTVVSGKWLKTDGTMFSSATGSYAVYNLIDFTRTYYITASTSAGLNGGWAAYWFVDANGNMLSCQEIGTGDGDLGNYFTNIPIVAPEGAVQLYLQADTANVESITTAKTIISNYTELILNNIIKINSDIDTINDALGIQSLELFIPDEFDIIVNKPVQIFKYPLTLLSDYYAYSISISTVGTGISCTSTRRFSTITATAAGTYTLKIEVLNDELKVLAEKTVTIHANTATSPATMKNILLVGDSETAGVGGIPYADEVKRLLTSNDAATNTLPAGLGLSNIQLIGSNGASVARHEGYGGWTCATFLSANSPFYVNGAIDFNAYLAKDTIYDNAEFKGVDLIYITLGINNTIDANVVNGKLVLSNQAHKSGLISLLSKIREQIVEGSGTYANPNLKVVLLSYAFTDTDAYDYSHNTLYSDGNIMAMKYVSCAKANAEVAAMDEFSGFVTAKILSAQIDSENAYPKVSNIKSNPYMDTYETNTYEGVHPNTIGYRMFGASVVNDIIGEF
jgi:hypothetical protein